MDLGPLPPHERTWRHPSEVAAAERAVARSEEAAPSTRMFALTTGTIGLLAVGVLIVTVTPRPTGSPVAVSASTTVDAVGAGAVGDSGDAARLIESVRPRAVAGTSTVISRPSAGEVGALVTPIGDGRFALATSASMRVDHGATIGVRFSSGRVGTAEIIGSERRVVLLELDGAEPAYNIARHRPDDDDMVTVMASPPITVAFGDVHTLHVHEGAAVFDSDGALVGLCSQPLDDGRVELIEVSVDLAGATTDDR